MKKLVYILVLFTGIVNAQIINIPDVNFKAKLLQAGITNTVALDNFGTPIIVDANGDNEIQLSEALTIYELEIINSNIADLAGIEFFTNLERLDCSNNQLTSLNVSSLINLYDISCHHNQLTYFNFTNIPNLNLLDCRNNQLTSLDFSGTNSSTSYMYVNCSFNLITNFIVSNPIGIGELICNNNQIQHLDLSKIWWSTDIGILYPNPILTINAKNNHLDTELILPTTANPAFQYICADENEIPNMLQELANNSMSSVVVNSYCTFVPGGNYNTINGTVLFDADSNGCVGDAPFPNIKINITNGTSQFVTYSNYTGNYSFYSQTGNFTLTPGLENPTFFNFSPPTVTIPFANNNNNVVNQNFCIAPNGIHPDLEVVFAPVTTARPGFDAMYKIIYKNKGNQTLSGSIVLNYDDAVLDFVSATITPSSQSTDVLNWNYVNLLPFENRSFYLTFNVNTPLETPAVNIGDQLDFAIIGNPIAGDENPSDNQFEFYQTVVGSFDPNDIICLEGNIVPPSQIGNYLHYIINFENTGTFEAENIVVRTDIDPAKFDINSLQMLNTSHNAYVRQTGNTIEFIFESIALETGGHGNVLLKIKSKSNLVTGDMVSNRAGIYFDYNAPVDTGLANTTFQALSNSVFEVDSSISVYPNPASSIINIKSDYDIKSIQLYDVQGRLLQTTLENTTNAIIDISQKSQGIYFLKITSDVGSKVEKIIKE
ncbi:MAG: T9SS type A sorting domain-containing protein [Bacteroidota bacterium]